MGRKKPLTHIEKTVTFHVISLFPEAFSSYIQASILARSIGEGSVRVLFYNPRDNVKPRGAQKLKDKPMRLVDDRPYGGGPGMVMKAEPVLKAIEQAENAAAAFHKKNKTKGGKKTTTQVVFLSPGGEQFTTETAHLYANEYTDVIIICGRYEGIDARVLEARQEIVEVSVGPWVTTGGELPALVMMDVIARQIPGVLGNFDSREEVRNSSHEVYTRPEILTYKKKKYVVPKVLLSGDHKQIDRFRTGGSDIAPVAAKTPKSK